MTHTNRRPRPGFTLVEILVVISIIALLLSLSTAAYQRVRITQAVRTSEDIVSKLQTGIDNQVKVIADNVREEQRNKSADFMALVPFCDGDHDRTAAVLLYCRLRQNFPCTQAELASPSFTMGAVTFQRPIAFTSLAGVSGGTPQQVSAACLYAALSGRTQGGNTFATDEATSGAQMDIPLGAVNARVFKDGWGNPIPFVRFYQSAELDAPPFSDGKFGTGPAPGKDTFDSQAKIYGWGTGSGPTNRPQVKALGTSGFSGFDFGHNSTMLVYSFGNNKVPDPTLGTVDDIMGYRLRSIGAKGAKP